MSRELGPREGGVSSPDAKGDWTVWGPVLNPLVETHILQDPLLPLNGNACYFFSLPTPYFAWWTQNVTQCMPLLSMQVIGHQDCCDKLCASDKVHLWLCICLQVKPPWAHYENVDRGYA